MPSDYAAITKYNEKKLGEDAASRRSQVNMYSDFTHFIFEILQNADDYGARSIRFNLLPEALIIEHNGQPFTSENVRAISYFGQSTSRDNLTKTGHFGLGFKAVFAFTATPQIHSGDEHFEIYGLYRLRKLPCPDDLDDAMTRITLPFNHAKEQPDYVEKFVPAEQAFERISKRLRQLDMTTLLFTRNLKEIQWCVPDENGHYLREDAKKNNHCEKLQSRKTTISDGDPIATYLIFERPIQWEGKTHKPVEIAFRFDDAGQIIKARQPLFVLFPTTVETHMGFLMNGPYRTPAHRETVAIEDEFNTNLIDKTAGLLTDAMPVIRDIGLLTVEFLETLPIRLDDLPEDNIFQPIVDAVRSALREQPLLPADDGSFVTGKNARLAESAELRKLLSETQLKDLFASQSLLKWISEKATQDLKNYLRYELEVPEIRAEYFARNLSVDFLEKQTDDWMANFYEFLLKPEDLWKKSNSILRKKKFIRLDDDSLVKPFGENGKPNAYFPGETVSKFPTLRGC